MLQQAHSHLYCAKISGTQSDDRLIACHIAAAEALLDAILKVSKAETRSGNDR